jgi:hypothetical protein
MLNPPLTFSVPTLLNDTNEARAKAERDFKKIVREAVWFFGPTKVKQVVLEITKRRKGNTPDQRRNAVMLAEYDAAPKPINKKKFAHEFSKRHREHSFEATEKHLRRLLKARQQAETKKKAERKFPLHRQGRSLLGTE